MTRFTDEDLTAWLDGEAAPELAARIEAAVDDADVADRLAALAIPKDTIKGGFDALLDMAPTPVLPDQSRARARAGAMGLIAASVASFALGLGVMWTQTRPAPLDWTDRAAIYHALYGPETLANSNPTPEEAQAQLAALGARLGVDLTPLASIDGLAYRRAQPLKMGQSDIVQIAFQDATGTPFAICLTLAPDMPDTPLTRPIQGLAATVGREGRVGYLVVGGQDAVFTARVAEQVDGML